MAKMHNVYLLLGSNEGDRMAKIAQAREMIDKTVGKVFDVSHLYETQPWGISDQPDYINMALVAKTSLTPWQLLKATQKIEVDLGRVRDEEQYGPRIIDIDILLFDQFVVDEPDLVIPHPRLQERNFMLLPLMEIAADLEHPILLKTIEELYFNSTDTLEVVQMEEE